MKRVLNIIVNIFISLLLLWTVFSAVVMTLAADYPELLPEQISTFVLAVSGVSTFLLGGGGVVLKILSDKTRKNADSKYQDLALKFLKLADSYTKLEVKVDNQTKTNNALMEKMNALERIEQARLAVALDNKYVTEEARAKVAEIMGEVIPETEQENEEENETTV